jgi:hypothetical protein
MENRRIALYAIIRVLQAIGSIIDCNGSTLPDGVRNISIELTVELRAEIETQTSYSSSTGRG